MSCLLGRAYAHRIVAGAALLGALFLLGCTDPDAPASPSRPKPALELGAEASPEALTPTSAPTETPTQAPTPTPTPRVVESPWIDLITPITGDTVTGPIRFEGRVNRVSESRRVTVQLLDAAGGTLAETTAVVMGEIEGPGNFSGQLTTKDYEGEARLVVTQVDTGATNVTRLTIKS